MASIIQAAKWMDEGKKVRRPEFGAGYFCLPDSNGYVMAHGPRSNRKSWFGTFDLLADDWEVYE